jgi:hypothetical protein
MRRLARLYERVSDSILDSDSDSDPDAAQGAECHVANMSIDDLRDLQ